eukprot:m.73329 g.73329  ORF g.73329 m.73329 type:complete len:87 (-) comp14326_c1_seq1:864-1124(-)
MLTILIASGFYPAVLSRLSIVNIVNCQACQRCQRRQLFSAVRVVTCYLSTRFASPLQSFVETPSLPQEEVMRLQSVKDTTDCLPSV